MNLNPSGKHSLIHVFLILKLDFQDTNLYVILKLLTEQKCPGPSRSEQMFKHLFNTKSQGKGLLWKAVIKL